MGKYFREKCFERFFRNIFPEKNFVKNHFAKRAFRSNASKIFSNKSFANCFEIIKIFEKILAKNLLECAQSFSKIFEVWSKIENEKKSKNK